MNKHLPLSSFALAPRLLRLGVLVVALPVQALAQGAQPAASVTAVQADHIVAVVNSEPITNREVLARMERLAPQLARQGQPVPPRAEFARLVLDRMISERAQVQAALAAGLRADDAAVDQAMENVARQNQMSVPQLQQRLAADGMTLERFRREMRDEILMGRLREREVEGRVRVSEQDVDRFLAERKREVAATPAEVNIAQILVAVPDNASAEQVAQLEAWARQLRQRLDAGADFAQLAREFSQSSDRSNGGQLGLRSAERYPPLFIEATRTLAVGGVAGPVRSGAGFHLLKLVEKRQADEAQDVVVQTRARHILLKPSPRLNEAQARQRLAEFKRRVEAGQADFAQLARDFSEDGSARSGGDLGWASPGMFVPEFEQVMDALKPGELSAPLLSRFGLHLIQVIERREVPLTERERRDLARREVREQKAEEALRNFLQDVRGRAYVEYREPPR